MTIVVLSTLVHLGTGSWNYPHIDYNLYRSGVYNLSAIDFAHLAINI